MTDLERANQHAARRRAKAEQDQQKHDRRFSEYRRRTQQVRERVQDRWLVRLGAIRR